MYKPVAVMVYSFTDTCSFKKIYANLFSEIFLATFYKKPI